MTDITKLIVEIDALAEKATKGPWAIDPLGVGTPWNIDSHDSNAVAMTMQIVGDPLYGQPTRTANAHLIAALVNAWPQFREMARHYQQMTGAAIQLLHELSIDGNVQQAAEDLRDEIDAAIAAGRDK